MEALGGGGWGGGGRVDGAACARHGGGTQTSGGAGGGGGGVSTGGWDSWGGCRRPAAAVGPRFLVDPFSWARSPADRSAWGGASAGADGRRGSQQRAGPRPSARVTRATNKKKEDMSRSALRQTATVLLVAQIGPPMGARVKAMRKGGGGGGEGEGGVGQVRPPCPLTWATPARLVALEARGSANTPHSIRPVRVACRRCHPLLPACSPPPPAWPAAGRPRATSSK